MTDEGHGNAMPFAMNACHYVVNSARPKNDGLDATAIPSSIRNMPVEVIETISPLIFWKRRTEMIAKARAPIVVEKSK